MDDLTSGKRLKQLREHRQLSLAQLASCLDRPLSRQSIAKYEADIMLPRYSVLQSLCKALCISPEYILHGCDYQFSIPQYRNRSGNAIPPAVLETLLAETNTWLASYLHAESLGHRTMNFVNPLEHLTIHNKKDTEQAAITLRQAWNMGDGPVMSLCRLAERKGIVLFSTPLPQKLLGISLWANNNRPVVLLNFDERDTTVERLRFTLAHELGHLFLKFADNLDFVCKRPDDNPEEKLCEIFAGNLLIPRATMYEELGRHRNFLTLEELIELRELYGVSISALVHQAHDLDIITDEHYNWWYDERINKNKREDGWGQYPVPEKLTKEIRLSSILSKEFVEEERAKTIP